ncbi:hypothetical protein GYMLUDRAFT_631275 [Collybiopsis luxurians FD-317 M1]|nr:hypothetical protein GYMLUDRAFT_631275 [Collybiopsis luxurians FD-317 M1]
MELDDEGVNTQTLQEVLDSEVKEWLFHIYFNQNNSGQYHTALELREAILRLRRDGAFVAVPLFRINAGPSGPHVTGSFEVWVPSETFAPVFSYLCQNRKDLSILAHPLTKDPYRDITSNACWMGSPLPLDLSAVPSAKLDKPPVRYTSLKLGYSTQSTSSNMSLNERKMLGLNVEDILRNEREAARAPLD